MFAMIRGENQTLQQVVPYDQDQGSLVVRGNISEFVEFEYPAEDSDSKYPAENIDFIERNGLVKQEEEEEGVGCKDMIRSEGGESSLRIHTLHYIL
jgi:hypothetical protein